MVKRAPARRRPRKAKPGTKGLGQGECRLEQPTVVSEASNALVATLAQNELRPDHRSKS
jgi:hypothetical protein